jgi:hypothetical protein
MHAIRVIVVVGVVVVVVVVVCRMHLPYQAGR